MLGWVLKCLLGSFFLSQPSVCKVLRELSWGGVSTPALLAARGGPGRRSAHRRCGGGACALWFVSHILAEAPSVRCFLFSVKDAEAR